MPSLSTRVPVWIVVVFLLAAFAFQNIYEMGRESCTVDEVVKFPAGFSYLLDHDFRLNSHHPPLLKILCALPPLLVLQSNIDFSQPSWTYPEDQARFGSNFLFTKDADRILLWGRLPVVFLTTLLGFVIFRWAQLLYGQGAGVFALTLFAFSPNFLAHSHWATLDAGVTAFLTLAMYFLWRFLRLQESRAYYWSLLTLAAALASKYTALFMLPGVALIFWIFHRPNVQSTKDDEAHSHAKAKHRLTDSHGANGEEPPFTCELFAFNRSKILRLGAYGVLALLLVQLIYLGSSQPFQYFVGIREAQADILPKQGLHYLQGVLKGGTWWYYYLVAFGVKATAGFLFLIGIRLFRGVKNWRSEWRSALIFILPSLIYFVAISTWAAPLGVRYLLPVFSLLMIFVSGVIKPAPQSKFLVAAVWMLLGWHVASSLRAFPHHLSYFNELAGGPSHGTNWLDDSNVDEGQELKALKKKLDEQNISEVYYYGMTSWDRPEYYGIRYTRLTLTQAYALLSNPQPTPGVYVFSAHWLARAKALGFDWKSRFPILANLGNSMFVFEIPRNGVRGEGQP